MPFGIPNVVGQARDTINQGTSLGGAWGSTLANGINTGLVSGLINGGFIQPPDPPAPTYGGLKTGTPYNPAPQVNLQPLPQTGGGEQSLISGTRPYGTYAPPTNQPGTYASPTNVGNVGGNAGYITPTNPSRPGVNLNQRPTVQTGFITPTATTLGPEQVNNALAPFAQPLERPDRTGFITPKATLGDQQINTIRDLYAQPLPRPNLTGFQTPTATLSPEQVGPILDPYTPQPTRPRPTVPTGFITPTTTLSPGQIPTILQPFTGYTQGLGTINQNSTSAPTYRTGGSGP